MSPGSRDGFTLLEAVVALAVVSLAAVAALTALSADLRTAHRARQTAEVTALAERRMELVRMTPAGDLQMLPDSARYGQMPEPFAGYSWEVKVAEVPGERELYRASVHIRWAGDGHMVLSSLLSRSSPATAAR